MEISKKEFINRAKYQYDDLVKMEKMAAKLEKKIAYIRNSGYKVIVLGSKVIITK